MLGFTREDLCACRVYQQKAKVFDRVDGLLRKQVADALAARESQARCEGKAATLKGLTEAALAKHESAVAREAVLRETLSSRWSALRVFSVGVCGASAALGVVALTGDRAVATGVTAGALGLVGCGLVFVLD